MNQTVTLASMADVRKLIPRFEFQDEIIINFCFWSLLLNTWQETFFCFVLKDHRKTTCV